MNCCLNCFKDSKIRELILDNESIGNCDFCKTKDISILSLENETLKSYFEALFDTYYPNETGKLMNKILKTEYTIFNDQFKGGLINKFLLNLLHDEKKIKVKYELHLDNIEEQAVLKNAKWKDFVQEVIRENRFHSEILNLDTLSYFIAQLKRVIHKNMEFNRARICFDKKGFKIGEMGSPPFEYSKSGRINPEGIRCLYLANSIDTAILEVRATKYDYVSIATFQTNKDLHIIDLTELNKLSPFFDLEKISTYIITFYKKCQKKYQNHTKTVIVL